MSTVDPQPRKYDVALSFAGENRDYVEDVATILAHRGIRVFYDRFEEADLWGKDLYDHLHYVYSQAADYCVVFASEAYAAKAWTTHERRSAQELALSEHREYVLPVRFDDTEIPGIRNTVGYIDLRTRTPDELAKLVSAKLGPRERTNYFPSDLTRLFASLNIADDPEAMDRAASCAGAFFREFSRLYPQERDLVCTILGEGCPDEMPENMHMNLERLHRITGTPKDQIPGILTRMRAFGFTYEEYGAGDGDPMVRLAWHDMTVRPDEAADDELSMQVASAIVGLLFEDRCRECAKGIIERCDFSPLAPADADD